MDSWLESNGNGFNWPKLNGELARKVITGNHKLDFKNEISAEWRTRRTVKRYCSHWKPHIYGSWMAFECMRIVSFNMNSRLATDYLMSGNIRYLRLMNHFSFIKWHNSSSIGLTAGDNETTAIWAHFRIRMEWRPFHSWEYWIITIWLTSPDNQSFRSITSERSAWLTACVRVNNDDNSQANIQQMTNQLKSPKIDIVPFWPNFHRKIPLFLE